MSNQESAPSNGFDRFGLHEKINQGIRAAGFEEPRPIQAETIRAALEGRDVLGLAQTGTGKTAAFALPLLDRIVRDRRQGPRVLILAPTRELATQISEEIRVLAKFSRVKMTTIFGGVSMNKQYNALRENPEIVVGCPGRVLDLVGQGRLRLGKVETLVLDEADHMFDMGFLPSIRKVIKALPRDRQNLLFSATMPREIRRLADDLLDRPHVVELADTAPASTIDHALYLISEGGKKSLLQHMLTREDCTSAIVFTRTKHRARRLAEQMSKAGINAVGLQGSMSQGQRDRAMSGFRDRRFDVLVATDIAARGIDVSGVSHVINFDVPNTPEAYTHRIGRTGRAELEGVACTFVTGADRGWVRATERMIGSPIPVRKVEGFQPDLEQRSERRPPAHDNRRGARPGGQQRSRNQPGGQQAGGRRRNAGGSGGNGGPSGGGTSGPRQGEGGYAAPARNSNGPGRHAPGPGAPKRNSAGPGRSRRRAS